MTCKLCSQEKPLEDSHIIPKFIYRHIKKESPTKRVRSNIDANKPMQDGEHKPFLCCDCEDMFGKFEDYFKREVFQKAAKNKLNPIEVNEKIFDFSVSVIWRTLKDRIVSNYKIDELHPYEIEKMNTFLNDCEKYFMTNNLSLLDSYNFHIIPTTNKMVGLHKIPDDDAINFRGTDASFLAYSKETEGHDHLISIVKIPFFLFIAEIIPNENICGSWIGTRLSLNKTILDEETITYSDLVIYILKNMRANLDEASKKLTQTSKQNIIEKIAEKNKKK
ncbi:hypothetical protein [Clostridioides difficile]|uniref:hypothetical protein n=1 Tax=Clostridioides difficile TaxID=1496 RepID=UPI00038D79EA|nr:hypothetical protein [Clostridioides difficile]EQH20987.1 hypothetical protein QM1_2697 [Clostridioides difficile DA00212]